MPHPSSRVPQTGAQPSSAFQFAMRYMAEEGSPRRPPRLCATTLLRAPPGVAQTHHCDWGVADMPKGGTSAPPAVRTKVRPINGKREGEYKRSIANVVMPVIFVPSEA